jgi:hypothetical protein
MKSHFYFIPIFFILIFSLNTYSQNSQIITGTVTDGVLPIAGARVMILADTVWATTDREGRFSLNVQRYSGSPVPVLAGKTGWFNNGWDIDKGSRNVELKLEAIPSRDNPNYEWIEPQPSSGGMMGMMGGASLNCGSCHANYYDRWLQSTMAKTTLNQKVFDQYGTAGDMKGQCADCHAPGAAVYAPGQTDLKKVKSEGGVYAEGVFCDFCHKIKDVEVSIKPGVQTVTLNRMSGPARRMGMMSTRAVVAYGPLADVLTEPMAAGFNSLYSKSEFCSSCHLDGIELSGGKTWDYKSVYPDADQADFDNGRIVPNQWTYMEWKNWQDGLSDDDPNKGQQCQDCHMNWTEDMLPYDEFIVEGQGNMMGNMMSQLAIRRDPSTLHPHTFEGATTKRLKNTAYLFVRPTLQGQHLSAMVSVTNTNTGHRLPTGVTFRSMVLLVEATDSTGKVLNQIDGPKVPAWEGTGNRAEGNFAGLPGVEYARVTADDAGNLNVPFWEATKIMKDNRPLPMKQEANTFAFDAKPAKGFITVKATLIYRKAIKAVAERYGWDTGDVVMEEKSKVVYQ